MSQSRPAEPTLGPGDELPARGSILGLDYGRVRVGVAVCDRAQSISSPLETVLRQRGDRELPELSRLAEDYDAVGFVVGLPLHTSGEESEMSREARFFGGRLREATGLPVAFFDERYTSAQAEDFLLDMNVSRHRRKHGERDMLAAHYILAGYLQERRQPAGHVERTGQELNRRSAEQEGGQELPS